MQSIKRRSDWVIEFLGFPIKRLFEGGARPVSFSRIFIASKRLPRRLRAALFKKYIFSKSLTTILHGKSFVNIYVKYNGV